MVTITEYGNQCTVYSLVVHFPYLSCISINKSCHCITAHTTQVLVLSLVAVCHFSPSSCQPRDSLLKVATDRYPFYKGLLSHTVQIGGWGTQPANLCIFTSSREHTAYWIAEERFYLLHYYSTVLVFVI